MPTFIIGMAANVRCYANAEIEAKTIEEAKEIAKAWVESDNPWKDDRFPVFNPEYETLGADDSGFEILDIYLEEPKP
jgi:hypothetical protein